MEINQIQPCVEKWERNGTDWISHLARIAAVSRRAATGDPEKDRRRVEHCWEHGHLGIFEHWPVVGKGVPWQPDPPVLPTRERELMSYGNLRHELEFLGQYKSFPYGQLHQAVILSPRCQHPDEELHTFHVTCSRVCSHQLVRYRSYMSIVQESQRYVNYTKVGGEYILPATATGGMHATTAKAFKAYEWELDDGAKPEDARYLLPGACATRMAMTAPQWEWDHVIAQRAHHSTGVAQEETAQVVMMIEELL